MSDLYKNRMAALGAYDGDYRRKNSQKIMDASWMRDVATKPVYVKWVDSGLPEVSDDDVPVYAKYNVKSYHTITGDSVAYLLQFRLADIRDNPNIRVGAYVKIPNEMGQMEWWLIVHEDDRTQFHQFSILKCTWTYRWVSKVSGKRIIYSCLGAPRKQNSYNSGVWLDYTAQTVENQEVMWLPTNDDTKTIQYDTKFLKSSPGRYPALKWSITKIEDSAVDGISMFTMAQTQFDPAKDNCDLMVADYWDSAIEPSEIQITPTAFNLKIAHSGSPVVRAGGSYKKLTLQQQIDEEWIDVKEDVVWFVDAPGIDWVVEPDSTCRIKCVEDYSLVGQTFTVTATYNGSSTTLLMEVIGL